MIISLILLLFTSFSIHILSIIQYISKPEKKYIRLFLNTAISNILIALALMYMAIQRPDLLRDLDMKLLTWLLSGLLFLLTLFIKIMVFRRVYQRAQMPENFHYNFFGKKVLHPEVIKRGEFIIFFGVMPFFLIAGSYFVARLINIIMYGHL